MYAMAPFGGQQGSLVPRDDRAKFSAAASEIGGLLGTLSEAQNGAPWVTPQVWERLVPRARRATADLLDITRKIGNPAPEIETLDRLLANATPQTMDQVARRMLTNGRENQ